MPRHATRANRRPRPKQETAESPAWVNESYNCPDGRGRCSRRVPRDRKSIYVQPGMIIEAPVDGDILYGECIEVTKHACTIRLEDGQILAVEWPAVMVSCALPDLTTEPQPRNSMGDTERLVAIAAAVEGAHADLDDLEWINDDDVLISDVRLAFAELERRIWNAVRDVGVMERVTMRRAPATGVQTPGSTATAIARAAAPLLDDVRRSLFAPDTPLSFTAQFALSALFRIQQVSDTLYAMSKTPGLPKSIAKDLADAANDMMHQDYISELTTLVSNYTTEEPEPEEEPVEAVAAK
jgi:hypothetical protein